MILITDTSHEVCVYIGEKDRSLCAVRITMICNGIKFTSRILVIIQIEELVRSTTQSFHTRAIKLSSYLGFITGY